MQEGTGSRLSGYAEAAEEIERFIRKQVEDAHCEGVVIGLSGGIDSAVVYELSCRAIGEEKVYPIFMPMDGNEPIPDGVAELIRNKELRIIEIGPIVKAFEEGSDDPDMDPISRGNIMARTRMTILYQLANRQHKMVIGTGNCSEIMLGYFTKYGDGGVDMEPIGGLYKTEVFAMARFLGIPSAIINRPPSAGLWDCQTDEDELGFCYDLIDRILIARSKFPEGTDHKQRTKAIATMVGTDQETVQAILTMIKRNVHKTKMPPTCPIPIDMHNGMGNREEIP